jgi:hypothetical protein
MPSDRASLRALRNLIAEAEMLLSTTTLPEGRASRAHELLRAAVALTDDLVVQASSRLKKSPAVLLGRKGGAVTAKRGSDYFRQLSAKRKTNAGGRPRKDAQ